ncbi:uncharacterized protein [Magallana gigas]|uniref:uncharacterized protein isoform X2 n=1 Tax=Magallana gigas TaxID=29159 RepID=UPI003340D060
MYHFAMEHRLLWLGLLQCVIAAYTSPSNITLIKTDKTIHKPEETDFASKPGRTEEIKNTNVEVDPDFALKVSIRRSKQKHGHCSKRIINICASYNGSNGTKMAVVRVKMQIGWIPVISNDLKNTTGLQKYEVNGDIVNFYFKDLHAERKCFNLDVEQKVILGNPKPAYVKIFDDETGDTGLSITKEYDIRTTCGTKEELPFLTPEEFDRRSSMQPVMQLRVPMNHPSFAPKPATMKIVKPKVKADPDFTLKVFIIRSKQKHGHCSKRTINICASYNGSSVRNNMTIVEVKMQTGWIPKISDDLKKTTGLQKYELTGDIVNFYFEDLDAEQKCFNLDVEQKNKLRNPKPAYVKIYDYFETDSSVTREYDIKTTCGTKEELPFLTPEEYVRLPPIMQARVPLHHPDLAPIPDGTGKKEPGGTGKKKNV